MPVSKLAKKLAVGAAAAAGVGAAMHVNANEAEAMPAGVYKKTIQRAGMNVFESSAAKRLKGYIVKEGKEIANVLKSRGKWRKIIFTDQTEMVVDKQYINDLARQVGRKQYIEDFREKATESKTVQALKSLQYHERRAKPFHGRENIRRLHRDHLKRLKEYKGNVLQDADTVFVTRGQNYFQMPKEYAEHLEERGILKILKGSEEQRVFKQAGIPALGENTITEAAIKMQDGTVYKGRTHTEAFENIPVAKQNQIDDADGFVDDKGRYYTREQAVRLTGAEATSQDAGDIVGREIKRRRRK